MGIGRLSTGPAACAPFLTLRWCLRKGRGRWGLATTLERVLLGIAVTALLAFCVLLALFLASISRRSGDVGVCDTPGCVKAAAHLLSAVDPYRPSPTPSTCDEHTIEHFQHFQLSFKPNVNPLKERGPLL